MYTHVCTYYMSYTIYICAFPSLVGRMGTGQGPRPAGLASAAAGS